MIAFKSRFKRIIVFFYECLVLVFSRGKVVPVRFFSARPNVGDALNVYLIEKVSGCKVLETKSGWLRHVLGVGSIMHLATSRSVAWGTGIIEESQIPQGAILRKMQYSAVRGKKTRELLSTKIGRELSCPMGDPAVLMPLYYIPKVHKKYPVGIVPHYADKETVSFKSLLSESNAKVINVELPVEKFLDELAECEVVISSSLHGLILSDAYNIPNVWVKFSDKIIGGRFKFLDYYSTTDEKAPRLIDLTGGKSIAGGLDSILSNAKVSRFTEDKSMLLEAFPVRL